MLARAIAKAEDREAEALVEFTTDPVTVTSPTLQGTFARGEARGIAKGIFDQLSYIDLRPKAVTVEFEGADQAVARFEFHWSASTNLYPNMRYTSEQANVGGAADKARVTFRREDGKWLVSSVEVSIRP